MFGPFAPPARLSPQRPPASRVLEVLLQLGPQRSPVHAREVCVRVADGEPEIFQPRAERANRPRRLHGIGLVLCHRRGTHVGATKLPGRSNVLKELFHFKLTAAQRETILTGAKCLDVSASEFVRSAAIEVARTVLEPPALSPHTAGD